VSGIRSWSESPDCSQSIWRTEDPAARLQLQTHRTADQAHAGASHPHLPALVALKVDVARAADRSALAGHVAWRGKARLDQPLTDCGIEAAGDRILSQGATGRVRVVLYNRPGTLAEVAGIFAKNHANVMNLVLSQRDDPFHTYEADLEVQDLAHLTRIVSALRASDAVAQADRI